MSYFSQIKVLNELFKITSIKFFKGQSIIKKLDTLYEPIANTHRIEQTRHHHHFRLLINR